MYYTVLLGTTRCYSVLLGTAKYYSVLPGTIQYYSVLVGSVGYYSALLGTGPVNPPEETPCPGKSRRVQHADFPEDLM